MRERLLIFLKLFLYWMLLMTVARSLFLLYNFEQSAAISVADNFRSLLYGLRMDLSMTGYFMGLVGLLLTLSVFLKGRWIVYGIASATFLCLIVSCLIVMVDMELYRHWGFRMNTTPLFYMGSEAMGSVSLWVIGRMLAVGVALTWFFGRLYFRWVARDVKNLEPAPNIAAAVLFPLTLSMIMFIRGSFSVAAMNTGFVYFHKTNMYANHAAINVVWNFFKSLSSTHIEYPEDFFDRKLTEQYFAEMYPTSDSTYRFVTDKKPNVILIIIESFTAGVIEPLGGIKGVAPSISALCKEGILFDNFYSSGDRTDKGLVSILSGYPAQPNSSIIKYPQKTQHLPFLNQKMKALGYHTSFVYGGDADFANFRSYLTASGFESITESDDFDSKLDVSKWGVQDGFVLNRALQQLDSTTSPFFKVILTQSSHEPFDVPMKPLFPPTNEENMFLNSCHYTDSCVGSFIKKLKASPQWKNTLVIITADHGHRHPHNKSLQMKERFHIPLLMLGGAVVKDSIVHTIGGQTDIANTLLAQLEHADNDFTFSKNLFSPDVHSHAVYYFSDGYGFITPGKFLVFENPVKQFVVRENVSTKEEDMSKACQQMLYSDYNKR